MTPADRDEFVDRLSAIAEAVFQANEIALASILLTVSGAFAGGVERSLLDVVDNWAKQQLALLEERN